MDEPWTELMHELGRVVESSGRMLQRKHPLSKQDLTHLRDTLNHAASTIQIVRDDTFKE